VHALTGAIYALSKGRGKGGKHGGKGMWNFEGGYGKNGYSDGGKGYGKNGSNEGGKGNGDGNKTGEYNKGGGNGTFDGYCKYCPGYGHCKSQCKKPDADLAKSGGKGKKVGKGMYFMGNAGSQYKEEDEKEEEKDEEELPNDAANPSEQHDGQQQVSIWETFGGAQKLPNAKGTPSDQGSVGNDRAPSRSGCPTHLGLGNAAGASAKASMPRSVLQHPAVSGRSRRRTLSRNQRAGCGCRGCTSTMTSMPRSRTTGRR
jgi:hypothetical protein